MDFRNRFPNKQKVGPKRLLKTLILLTMFLIPFEGLLGKGLPKNSLSLTNGIYAADGFGSNYYVGLRFNHLFKKWHYFAEASIGFSSLKSEVLNDLASFQVFNTQRLNAYEFLVGYDHRPLSGLPYFVAGVAGVNQGGQSRFAYVFGFGKHIPLSQFFNVKKLGFRYDIRDHIFRQTINDSGSFTSHNLVFSFGLQYYF